MPRIDAVLFKKKAEKKIMRLVLADDEDILDSVRAAMAEQGISECRVEDASGRLKQGLINFFEGNRYRKAELTDAKVFRASGCFKLSFAELWGTLHISANQRKPITGTLVKGKAAEGFEVRISFIKEIPSGEN